ncbi:morphogenic membrane protein MmpB [Embleya sp. NPDC020630]
MRNRDEFSEETRRAVAQLRRALWILPVVLILGLALLAL